MVPTGYNAMSNNGYAIYKNTSQSQTDDPRDIEYRLLAQVTAGLMSARDNPNDVKNRVEAALRNRQVWSALRVDLSSEGNQLPKQLRASLISISLWIERETSAVMDGSGDIDALIDVNRNIMLGLKPDLAQEPPAQTAPAE